MEKPESLEKRKNIGALIKGQRKRLRLTQEEVAEKINISEKHYSKIESGAYFPNLLNFFALAEVLDLDIGEFNKNQLKTRTKEKDITQLLKNANDKQLEICAAVLKTLLGKL